MKTSSVLCATLALVIATATNAGAATAKLPSYGAVTDIKYMPRPPNIRFDGDVVRWTIWQGADVRGRPTWYMYVCHSEGGGLLGLGITETSTRISTGAWACRTGAKDATSGPAGIDKDEPEIRVWIDNLSTLGNVNVDRVPLREAMEYAAGVGLQSMLVPQLPNADAHLEVNKIPVKIRVNRGYGQPGLAPGTTNSIYIVINESALGTAVDNGYHTYYTLRTKTIALY